MQKTPSWSGTSSELLAALIAEGANSRLLPAAPNAVSHEMNRSAPVLRRLGIHYYADKNTRKRIKHLERIAPAADSGNTATTATTASTDDGAHGDAALVRSPGSDRSGSSDDPAIPYAAVEIDPDEVERLAELALRAQEEARETS
jgi:hypothetical protein